MQYPGWVDGLACGMHHIYFVILYMFWAYLGPSTGGTTICIQQLVQFQTNQDNRQSSKKNNEYQLLYTYGCTS